MTDKEWSWDRFFGGIMALREVKRTAQSPSVIVNAEAKLWSEAAIKSARWDTCACGELDDGIPRHGHEKYGLTMRRWPVNSYLVPDADYRPEDKDLRMHGYNFHTAICNRDLKEAIQEYNRIQKRAAIVLNDARKEGHISCQ